LSYAPRYEVPRYENAARPGSRGRQARHAGCALRAPPTRVRRFGIG